MEAKLHPYQKRAVDWVLDNTHCALYLDMGLGKTLTTLTAIKYLLDGCVVNRVLVVAPLRVTKHVWPDEIKKWDHIDCTYTLVHGAPSVRLSRLGHQTDVHLINYENLKWLVKIYGKKWPYDMVVLDESSRIKNVSAKRTRAIRSMLPYIDRFVELTGTPAPNGLLDLWSQIFMLDRGERLGKTVTGYKNKYFTPDYQGWSWAIKQGAQEVIQEKISDICLSMNAAEYLTLPKRIDSTIKVYLSDFNAAEYKELERELIATIKETGQEVTAVNSAVLTNKCLQFANGAVYDEDGAWWHIHSEKMTALEDIIEEANGEPILIAYQYKHDAARLRAKFDVRDVKEPGAIDAWNVGKIPIMIAHPASAGHGLNLQHGGNIIVWFGLTWNLEQYQQFNARLHRQGQSKPVMVHHLVVDGTMDERALMVLQGKATVQNALLDFLKETD